MFIDHQDPVPCLSVANYLDALDYFDFIYNQVKSKLIGFRAMSAARIQLVLKTFPSISLHAG